MVSSIYSRLRKFERFASRDTPSPDGETHGYMVTEYDLDNGQKREIYLPMDQTTIRIERNRKWEAYMRGTAGLMPMPESRGLEYEQKWLDMFGDQAYSL